MKNTILKTLCGALILTLSAHNSFAQDKNWTKAEAKKWISGSQWLNGLQLKVYSAIDTLEFAKQYHKNKALWDKAFAYLKETNLETIAPGKYLLDSTRLFVSITEGPTKDFSNTKWESHKKYIDIQYVIKGKEKMGKVAVSKTSILTPYDANKDVAFYHSEEGEYYEAQPGTFLIFFPEEAHRPGIKIDGTDTTKKIVVKIIAD